MSAPPSAALDIGSNSVHLLVAGRDQERHLVPLLDVSHKLGIGSQVDGVGVLGPDLRASLLTTVGDFLGQARALGAGTVLVMGTEPVRLASDAPDLAAELRRRMGLRLVVLDRATEGLLTLLGVSDGALSEPLAVVDIGGGSTEVTVASEVGPPVVGSVPVGSARLAAAHIRHDPVDDDEVAMLRAMARDLVSALEVPPVGRAVIAGGSGTNVSRLLGRERTTPVDRGAIDDAFRLLRTHPAETLAARTGLTVGRVRQLAAGLVIAETLLDRLGLDVVDVSDASLREGALIASWAAGDDWLGALPGITRRLLRAHAAHPADDRHDRAS